MSTSRQLVAVCVIVVPLPSVQLISPSSAAARFAPGIALRGLTVGGTLTLLDSERMVAYPLSDDGERSFVDVSAIPFNAIDSIDVLKDGASSLYGADAIAGVVNIKLKPTYVGTEVTAEGGATQHNDGWTWHGAAIMGSGDLESDGYNIYAALDWHRQEMIQGANRNGPWTNNNWSSLPGGINATPGSPTQSAFTYPDSIQGYVLNPSPLLANGTYANGLPAATFLTQGRSRPATARPRRPQANANFRLVVRSSRPPSRPTF